MSEIGSKLKLFIDNDSQIYRQRTLSAIKNLMTKRSQGKYDRNAAVKLFMYIVEAGAKKYVADSGSSDKWNILFPKYVREDVALDLRDDFEEEADTGSYDEYIPKKYQKKDAHLRSQVIRLAHAKPDLRKHLLPLLK